MEHANTKPRATVWASIREAVRGSEHDYTSGPLARGIVLLAIPMVLEMCMESLFAVVDVFWVARLGADAVASVGLTESVMSLVSAIAYGLSLSTTAMVARRIGEKDPEQAAVSAVQAIALGLLISIPIAACGFFFGREVLAAMGASREVMRTGGPYTTITLASSAALMLLYLNNAIFRGAGDPAVAMRVLWAANLLNLVLAPFLIFGIGPFPKMGVTGSAVSTAIARTAGVTYQLWLLSGAASRVRVRARHCRLHATVLWRLIRVSALGILQFVIIHTSWIVLIRMISAFGSQAVAGYTIAIRIITFVILPSWGLSGAAATMVGQNLGAGRPDRAERAVWLTGIYNVVFLGLLGIVLVATPGPIARLFTSDNAVIPFAVAGLRVMSYGNLGYAYEMVMVQAFNGAGDTVTPTWINIFGFWVLEIPLAWFLAFQLGMRSTGVFAAIAISETANAVAAVLLFRRGRWKARRI